MQIDLILNISTNQRQGWKELLKISAGTMMDNAEEAWYHQLDCQEPLFDQLSGSQIENITIEDWIVGQDDVTRDVALVPDSKPMRMQMKGRPASGHLAGPFNFEIQISGTDTNRKKYLYSHKLNRIYVDMCVNFPVHFRWDWERCEHAMLVRATLAFADESDAEKRVERCIQHQHPDNNLGFEEARSHVLRSTRPPNSEGVFYSGVDEDQLSWYSVAVLMPPRPPLPAIHLTHAYTFACKSSCSSGINRRPIQIVFTLEDTFTGEVVGRQCVGVRVCACPRRDLKKDEEAPSQAPTKRRSTGGGGRPAKRASLVKTESQEDDLSLHTFPSVLGRETYKLGLAFIKQLMLASTLKLKEDQSREAYAQVISNYDDALSREENQ